MRSGESLRSLWASKVPAFGAWCSIPNPIVVEVMALAGYPWVGVDLQHGLAGWEHAAALFQSISIVGSVPLARVPSGEPWAIMRALDLGATGVIVPLVRTAHDAETASRACRYPPDGVRSYGPVRVSTPTAGSPADANRDVLCLPMIETAEAVDNLEEICRTDGVDGVYVGPKDLGLALNLPPGEELESVVAEIARRAGACGTPAGIHTRGGSGARAYAESGFLWAAVATDREFLFEASRSQFEEALGGSTVVSPTVESPLLRATTSYVATGR